MANLIDEHRLAVLKAILRTVAYEDVFDYPLTAVEIHRFLTGLRTTPQVVEEVLHDHPRLSLVGDFFTLPGREGLVELRQQRERAAARWWPEALRFGRLIASLPFVRMLAVTGSLAMNNINVAESPDIDYLIVTAAGRLWMCRALALGVARMAALRGVRLCPNYLISERALVFPDQNLYTAHEMVQMVPIYGMNLYADIRRLNDWTGRFLPNAVDLPPQAAWSAARDQKPGFQSFLEAGLLLSPGSRFERWEMERKIRMLSNQEHGNPEVFFSADICKGHANRHGQQTEQIFRRRLTSLSLDPYP